MRIDYGFPSLASCLSHAEDCVKFDHLPE